MISLLLKRFIHGLIVLWAVATLTFTLFRLAPGGPFDSERKLPPEILANLEAKYHLNEPLIEQYLRYLAGIARGDLGPSYKYLDRGVTEIIADTLPTSALLGGLAIVFALGISFPIGLIRRILSRFAHRPLLFIRRHVGHFTAQLYSRRVAHMGGGFAARLASSRPLG